MVNFSSLHGILFVHVEILTQEITTAFCGIWDYFNLHFNEIEQFYNLNNCIRAATSRKASDKISVNEWENASIYVVLSESARFFEDLSTVSQHVGHLFLRMGLLPSPSLPRSSKVRKVGGPANKVMHYRHHNVVKGCLEKN